MWITVDANWAGQAGEDAFLRAYLAGFFRSKERPKPKQVKINNAITMSVAAFKGRSDEEGELAEGIRD